MSHPVKPRAPARRELVNIRISPDDRNVIDLAARAAGKTRTEFMIDAARRAAHDSLLDTTLVLVDGGTFAHFKKLFDAPAQPNALLRALVRLKAPWEE